jgi:hypothetical protein
MRQTPDDAFDPAELIENFEHLICTFCLRRATNESALPSPISNRFFVRYFVER